MLARTDSSHGHNGHALALQALGRYPDALDAIKKALDREPGDPNLRRNLNLIVRDLDRTSES